MAKVLQPEAYGLTPDVEALILDMGTEKGIIATTLAPAKKAKAPKAPKEPKERKTLLSGVEAAIKAGTEPPPITFPASNYWSQKHADALHGLMKAGDAAGLEAYHIGGTNTYAKALRRFRDALVAYVKATPTIPLGGAAEGTVEAPVDTSDIPEQDEAFFQKAKVVKKAPAKPKAPKAQKVAA